MHVRVDAAGHDDAAPGVDDARALRCERPGRAERGDDAVLDGDFPRTDAVRGHHTLAADQEIEHAFTSSSNTSKTSPIHCASSPCEMTTMRVLGSSSGQASSQAGGWNTCCTPWITAGRP